MSIDVEVTIALRYGVNAASVRSSLARFIAGDDGILRLDRPLRGFVGGRHFHLAAPSRGTGTIEVNLEPDDQDGAGIVRIVLRPHWTGTWGGDASLRLAEYLAKELGEA